MAAGRETYAPPGDIEVAKLLVELSKKLGRPLDPGYHALAEAQPTQPDSGSPSSSEATRLFRPAFTETLMPAPIEPTLTEGDLREFEEAVETTHDPATVTGQPHAQG